MSYAEQPNIAKPYRPTPVLVLAILCIVFGSTGLLCTLWNVASLVIPQDQQTQQIMKRMEQEIPAMYPVQYTQSAISICVALMELIVGIGLLSMKPWARVMGLAYAGISILYQIANVLWFVLVFQGPYSRILATEMGKVQGKGADKEMVKAIASGASVLMVVVIALVAIFVIGFALTILIILTRRSVIDAFAGKRPPANLSNAYTPLRTEPFDYRDPPSEGITERGPGPF